MCSFCFFLGLITDVSSYCNTSEVENGLKKPELFRNPRYTDIRMDEVYAAKKSRFRTLSGKENAKVCT